MHLQSLPAPILSSLMRVSPLIAVASAMAVFPLRAADPVISEFMADNAGYPADEDGQFMDWIEVYNPGPASVDLAGWALTDDSAAPQKWVFPSRIVTAGQSVVVWASGKNRTGAQLHTNFSLNDAGEYLALVKPDGTTRTSEWNPYPPQKENVSWGAAQQLVTQSHLDAATGRAWVPSGGSAPASGWNAPGFVPDGSWITSVAPPGLGYDVNAAPPPASNVAPAGTASQSTTNGPYAATLGTDGVLTNFTHTLGTDSAAFWNLEFNGTATIHSITMRNRGDGCCPERLRDITISILDGTNTAIWTSTLLNPENTGYTYNTGPASLTVDLVALTGAAVQGRHVRVSRTADPDGSGIPGAPAGYNTVDAQNVLSLGEVEIIGFAPNAQVNLARTGSPLPTATQTSTLGGFTANLGIDGLNNNFTHTVSTDTAPAWTLNLNRRAAISTVNLHNREGCCPERLRDITIRILDTDGTTVLHTSPQLNPANALLSPADLVYDVAAANGGNPVAGQFIRVSRTVDAAGGASDDARVLALAEVQVRGTELNGLRPYIHTDVQSAMKDNSPTAYWRLPFNVADPAALTGLSLRIRYNDGFIAYLNGTQVASRNAPAGAGQNSTATDSRSLVQSLASETIDLGVHTALLTAGGGNVLAIHGLNSSAGDDTFLLQPELSSSYLSTTPNVFLDNATPATLNNSTWYLDEVADTVFSHRRGFYDAPFNLTITSATPGAQIYYTTNFSEPTPTNGTLYTDPINIQNPGGSYSGTRVIRARAFKANWKPTNIDTHTYIFPDNVAAQTKGTLTQAGAVSGAIPAGWPTSAATNGNQAFNFGFTAAAMTGYPAAQIREGLTQIPSISIVSQQNHLTDPVTGIYVNGVQHGGAWERPASIEFLDYSKPGATPEAGHGQFSDNIGLRLRGGASRADNYTKHSFRCFWRREYGNGKLQFRLYGAEGAAEFENFDLRGSQNYSWSNSTNGGEETLVRDPFCRELLGAMGQQWTRSRFCHLYLNGLYWGIFEIHERPENSYGETYLGGDKNDYDVVKNHDRHSGVAFSTEATDGYLLTNPDGSRAAWKELWDRCKEVKANPTNANYFRILGCNPDGTRNPAYPVLLDVDNLIDYMLAIFYSGDGDACLSGFLGPFNQPNNWHGMRDRMGDRGFTFFNHDAEHTLRASSWAGSRSVAATDQTGPWGGSNQNNFTYSNPQWMHEELMASPEYRLRWADHIRRHFFNGGALTPNQAIARWNARAATITKAIVPYAGRYATSSTVITTWKNLCGIPGESVNGGGIIDNVPQDFLAMRTNLSDLTNPQNLLRQLTVDGLWPALAPADFAQHGGSVPGGYQLSISGPAGAQIFYTLDGTDPRAVGAIPTPLTYASTSAATRYYVTTAATGGDNGFSSAPVLPPSPGPVSRYLLDGNANDSVGANHGTPQNAPAYGTDRNGNANSAIVLNGTNQAVTLGDPASLQITGQITVAAWVNPVTAAALRNIVNKGHNTGGAAPNASGEITLRVNTGANVNAGSWNGSDHLATFTGGATINTWQHFASVYDGTTWRLYKNGAQVASTVDPVGAVIVAGAAAANNAWNIGSRGGSPTERAFHGSIDDVAIYNRGLTPTEVLALYNPSAIAVTADWKDPAYSIPGSWGAATGGIGYDTKAVPTFTPHIAAPVPAMQGASSTLLTRKDFLLVAQQIADTGYLQLNVRYDDGFIAYLNGVKIAERNAPATTPASPSGTSAATAVRTDADAIIQEKIDITAFRSSLVAGNNVLAIQGLNTAAADNDFLLEAEIVAADNATLAQAPVAGSARLYTGPLTLNSPVTVQTRVFQNGQWSALTSAFFSVATEAASASNLVISEIHYHPENPSLAAELAVSPDKDEFEFIELMNISPSAVVDLSGIRFTAGITTTPLGNEVFQPGERAVFVKNPAAFQVRYGSSARVLGVYTGSLNNQGEQIILNAGSGAVIRDFVFDDNAPWPEAADGAGMSLSLVSPLSNPDHSLVGSWRGSTAVGGSPGTGSFAAWKAANAVVSNDDDGDGDGLTVILEYALGGDPGVPDSLPPVVGMDGEFLTFSLVHRETDDATITPQTSSDLNGWSSDGITLLSRTPQPDGTTVTVWRAPVGIAGSRRLYFRGLVNLQ
jgi:hypothetical protein